uniref:TMC domain-containing protein n=1 Tax=Heterorhabditis bacteriophora TaxID=37862 RepID=A0A1I7WXC0_HETBA
MLPFINNLELITLMYMRAWAVMTCSVPARQIFRTSRSSNFYLMLLLLMPFLCTLPVGHVIASREPSKSCGPFRDQPHFYSVITDVLHENLNAGLVDTIKYMTSPGIVIPVLLLLLNALRRRKEYSSRLEDKRKGITIMLHTKRRKKMVLGNHN